MKCLVFVKFLPISSIQPGDFFSRINAEYSCLDDFDEAANGEYDKYESANQKSRTAICITDYDSVEQFTIDLSIMPGAGILNIEIIPVSDEVTQQLSSQENPLLFAR